MKADYYKELLPEKFHYKIVERWERKSSPLEWDYNNYEISWMLINE
jgi:hypothetical protein